MRTRVYSSAHEIRKGGPASERSMIEFPYTDLDNAIEVARAVNEIGLQGCRFEDLASQLATVPRSCAFRTRVVCARTFGLISYARSGPVTLSRLGRRIIDPAQEAAARAAA